MKKFLFVLLQCTWGICQTVLGAIVFLRYRKCPHKRYRGCIASIVPSVRLLS